jgi:hypothetical protein
MAVILNASTSSGLVQSADTSGEIALQSNGSTKLTVASTGVSVTSISGTIIQGTVVASTSGTSIDFTSIPNWVKQITVMFNNVSTNGSSNFLIQIGSGSITSSGYITGAVQLAGGNSVTGSTDGYIVTGTNTAGSTYYGNILLNLISANTWQSGANLWNTAGAINVSSGASGSLSGALDRIRITTINGTDIFDNGLINIQYKG